MAVDQGGVAAAALIIAVVAFIIACCQLLQQLFSTADGHRRCQSSVIGDWSRLVRLKPRWTSFRIEVRVTTPHFEVCSLADAGFKGIAMKEKSCIPITGSTHSRRATYSRQAGKDGEDEEDEDAVSWTSLLKVLHDRQFLQLLNSAQTMSWLDTTSTEGNIELLASKKEISSAAIICLKLKNRSWDLMPPDIVRPVASTTLGALITIAHRLGMEWIDLEPQDGKLRAEGLGQSLSAMVIRSMGLVVEFHKESSLEPRDPKLLLSSMRIPSAEADKMACGIIPGNPKFGTWDISLRTKNGHADIDLITSFLQKSNIKVSQSAIDAIRESTNHSIGGYHYPAFADLLGMWTDWLPLPDHSITEVACPFTRKVFPMCEVREARVVWRWCLQQLRTKSPLSVQMQKILDYYDTWYSRYPSRFEDYFYVSGNRPEEKEHLHFLKGIFDDMTRYLDSLCLKYRGDVKSNNGYKQPSHGREFYINLVASHISVNASSLKQAEERIHAGQGRNDGRVGMHLYDSVFAERAFLYTDNVPGVIGEMKSRGFAQADVEDAWWSLALKSQAWQMGINRVPNQGAKVPSNYYKSPTKVYIL